MTGFTARKVQETLGSDDTPPPPVLDLWGFWDPLHGCRAGRWHLYFRLVSDDLGFLKNTAGVDSEKEPIGILSLDPWLCFEQ